MKDHPKQARPAATASTFAERRAAREVAEEAGTISRPARARKSTIRAGLHAEQPVITVVPR